MWSMRSRTKGLAALLACVTLAALVALTELALSPSAEPSELVQAEEHHSGLELFSRFSGRSHVMKQGLSRGWGQEREGQEQ